MGKPDSNVIYTLRYRSEPGEVKHLSTLRKRNQIRDSLSSGERTGNSPKVEYVLVEAVGKLQGTG